MKPILRLRSWGVTVALPLLILLQAFTPSPALMLCLLILIGLFLSSLVWLFLVRKGLVLERVRSRDWAQLGDPFEERFRLTNRSWLPVPWAEVQDWGDLPGYNIGRAMGLTAGSANVWVTRGTCDRRGVYTMGPTRLILGDPFGFFELALDLDDARTFYVTPAVRPIPSLARPRTMAYSSSRNNTRYMEMNDTVASIRPYAPGDPFKRIHWRSTAHRSLPEREEIWVKQLDPNPQSDCWLILDLDGAVHLGEDLDSTEEYAITLAASLTHQLIRDRRAVGILAGGAESVILEPQHGQEHLWGILRVLAGLHADGILPMAELLAQARSCVRPGDSIILITPSTDVIWPNAAAMFRQTAHMTAYLIDGQSFDGAGELHAEGLDAVREALARLGVACHTIARGSFMLLPEVSGTPSGIPSARGALGGRSVASGSFSSE